MKITGFPKLLALVAACVSVITALPSNVGTVPGISPRGNDEVNSLVLPPRGITCGGNFNCESGYCPPDIKAIKQIVNQIPDDAVFANYKNIACARCATEEERPADYKQGICVYSSGVKSNISITGKAVKDSVNALIANGCTRCGSVPIVPGAKDDSEGNIQINFVRGACETGICPQQVIREVDDTSAAGGSVDTSSGAESVSALTYDNFADKAPATTPRSAAPDSADTLLGINCRGSGSCTGSCERQIYDFQYYLQWLDGTIPYFQNGQHIACLRCWSYWNGICLFAQSMPQGESLHWSDVKGKLNELVNHGCKGCGSVPLHPGNDVKKGQLTVNYTTKGVWEGILPPKSGQALAITPRSAAPDSANTLLGINCRGSARCSKTCGRNIHELKAIIDKLDGSVTPRYANGQKIACVMCRGQYDGICAYAQNMPKGKYLDYNVAKEKVNDLVNHGCQGCGSVPLYPGNDVSKGQFTVNFTSAPDLYWGDS